jgi:Homeodomain-like domain
MDWKQLLISITSSVDEELRLRNTYLVTENRILRQQMQGRVQLTASERRELAEIGQRLGKKALEEMATIAKPDTILGWHRRLANQSRESSRTQTSVGRPRISKEIEALVVRMARENRSWGYDRIVGALANVGYTISDQTVGNILKRHSIPPAPERQKTVPWREFIRIHLDVLGATDFFNSALWSGFGLLLSSLLCFSTLSRQHVNAVGRLLHQWRHEVHFLVLHARNIRQRWVYWITTYTRSGAMRCHTGLQGITLSVCTPEAERQLRTQAMGKVVCWSAARAKQIRDGPMQRRQRLTILLKDDLRRAA